MINVLDKFVERSTVYVVDDEPLVRSAISRLAEFAGYRVRAFGSAEEFAEHFEPEGSNCVILDNRLEGISGIELLEKLANSGCTSPVVLITGYATTDTVVRAMQSGAVTVLDKPFDSGRLLETVREALERSDAERQQRKLLQERLVQFGSLTDAERAVLRLMVEGCLNKQMSKQLGVSLRTVEQRRQRVFRKTNTRSVAELVAAVVELRASGQDVLAEGARAESSPEAEGPGGAASHRCDESAEPAARPKSPRGRKSAPPPVFDGDANHLN